MQNGSPVACGNSSDFLWVVPLLETLVRSLDHVPFSRIADRIAALYNEDEDALLLDMLGQEYMIRHDGISLYGQQAPESHVAVILDYVLSSGAALEMTPWRSIGELSGRSSADFRKHVELPITTYAPEIISRANTLLPMLNAAMAESLIGSDMAINVRALPKVYLHAELSQESADFPAEAWVLFSNNAREFVTPQNLQTVAELFKDRLLSLLRIY